MSDDYSVSPSTAYQYQATSPYAATQANPYRDYWNYGFSSPTNPQQVFGGDDPGSSVNPYPAGFNPQGLPSGTYVNGVFKPTDTKYADNFSWNVNGNTGGEDPNVSNSWSMNFKGLPAPSHPLGNPTYWYAPVDATVAQSMSPQEQAAKGIWNDPNYGWMSIGKPKVNLMTQAMDATPYAAMAAAGTWAAPMIAGGLGLEGTLGNSLVSGAMSLGKTAAMGGDLVGGAAKMAGSYLGGMTGIPGASTIGGWAGGQLTSNPISAVQHSQGQTNMGTPTYPDGGSEFPYIPNDTGTTPVDSSVPTPVNTSGGGWNPITAVGGAINNIVGNSNANPNFTGSALGSAANDYLNMRDYNTMLTKYVPQLDPFGSQRQGYQGLLKQSYDDPMAYLNNPAHKAMQDSEMANILRTEGASGYMGSGNEIGALGNFLTSDNAKYLAAEQERLANLSGSQFGPGAASNLITTGLQGVMDNRSRMLADANRTINPNPTQNGGTNPNGTGMSPGQTTPGGSPVNAVNSALQLSKLVQIGGQVPTGGLGNIPAGSIISVGGNVLDASGKQIGVVDKNNMGMVPSYPTTGEPSYGGSGYDPTNTPTDSSGNITGQWDNGSYYPSISDPTLDPITNDVVDSWWGD